MLSVLSALCCRWLGRRSACSPKSRRKSCLHACAMHYNMVNSFREQNDPNSHSYTPRCQACHHGIVRGWCAALRPTVQFTTACVPTLAAFHSWLVVGPFSQVIVFGANSSRSSSQAALRVRLPALTCLHASVTAWRDPFRLMQYH